MITKLTAANPDEIEMTLTVTRNLGQWKKLREQLAGSGYPGFTLQGDISDMVRKASQHFSPDAEDIE